MSGIERYEERAAVGRPSSPRLSAGSGRSVDDCTWGGTVLEAADIGLRPRPEGGDTITSSARQMSGVRKAGDWYYRRRYGWIAQVGGVLVGVSDQPLRPQPDGRFKPSGSWSRPREEWHALTAPPRVRRGEVPVDAPTSGTAAPPSAPPAVGGKRVLGEISELSFLPEPLRRSAMARASDAHMLDAHAVRYSRDDGVGHFTVSVLILGPREGLVILASRQDGARTWQAEQTTYQLLTERHAIGDGR